MNFPRRRLIAMLGVAALTPRSILGQTRDDRRRAELLANAQEALEKLFATVEGSRALYDQAVGYAVFTATKAGFFVTGGGGSGVCSDKATGQNTFMKMGTGGAGLGFGAQRYELVILFEDASRLATFIDGGWDGGVAASATAGDNSVGAASGFLEGTAVFTLDQRGVMAAADISGTRFWVNGDLN